MFTIAARSLASAPSGRSGYAAYAMSVTTSPSTESPRNSRRSFVISVPVLERVRAVRERGRPERGVVERHAEGAVQGLERRLDGNGASRRYSTSTA